MCLPGSEESKLAGACWLRGPGVPPLPGLRASSLPPAPGYESDEEGGLCNEQNKKRSDDTLRYTVLLHYIKTTHETATKHRTTRSSSSKRSLSSVLLETNVTSEGLFRGVRAQYRCPSTGNTIDEAAAVDFDLD